MARAQIKFFVVRISEIYHAPLLKIFRQKYFKVQWKFQKHEYVSLYHCQREPFINSVFIAYKKDERWGFLVRNGSPALILFHWVSVVSFYFSFFYFLPSQPLAEVLRYVFQYL